MTYITKYKNERWFIHDSELCGKRNWIAKLFINSNINLELFEDIPRYYPALNIIVSYIQYFRHRIIVWNILIPQSHMKSHLYIIYLHMHNDGSLIFSILYVIPVGQNRHLPFFSSINFVEYTKCLFIIFFKWNPIKSADQNDFNSSKKCRNLQNSWKIPDFYNQYTIFQGNM